MIIKKLILSWLVLVTTVSSNAYGKVSLDNFVGSYSSNIVSSRIVNVSNENSVLFLDSKGQGKFKLILDEGTKFTFEGHPIMVTFVANKQGHFDSFKFTKKGRDKIYTRLETLRANYEKVSKQVRPHGLSDAILMNDLNSVKSLIKSGIDMSELDTRKSLAGPNGRRPLNWAALENNTAMISLLLSAGVDINMTNLSGFTPLHHAVEAEAIEATQLLLKKGAKVNLQTKSGRTALEIAAIRNNQVLMKLLQSDTQ